MEKASADRKLAEELVSEIRSNPEKYAELRQSVLEAQSDDERANLLIDFATDEDTLRRLVPDGDSKVAHPTITTTTVLI